MYCGDIPFEIAYKHKTGFLSHCWNKLNGEVVDLTRAQFSPEFPHGDLVAGRLGAIKKISKEVLLTDSLLAQNYMAFSRLLSPLLAKTRGHKAMSKIEKLRNSNRGAVFYWKRPSILVALPRGWMDARYVRVGGPHRFQKTCP